MRKKTITSKCRARRVNYYESDDEEEYRRTKIRKIDIESEDDSVIDIESEDDSVIDIESEDDSVIDLESEDDSVIDLESEESSKETDESDESSKETDESEESSEETDESEEEMSEGEPVYMKRRIPLTVKRLVWNKYIGEEKGKAKCYCCRLTDITQMSFHCGHVKAERHGGSIDVENLRPICQSCNSSMGTRNMHEFIETCGIHKFNWNKN